MGRERDFEIVIRAGGASDAVIAEMKRPTARFGNRAGQAEALAAEYERTHPAEGPFLPQIPCMLSQNAKHLSREEMGRLLADPAWVAEEKYDGCRAKLHIGPAGNRLDTRNRLPATHHYHEITDNLPHLASAAMPALAGTVLDGELLMPGADSRTSAIVIATAGPETAQNLQRRLGLCRFVAFDCMFFRGRDIRERPFRERRKALEEVVTWMHAFGVLPELALSPVVEIHQAAGLYARVTAAGGEGVMLKNLDAPYSMHHSRRVSHQLKWKKMREVDGFITGFVPGDLAGEFANLVGAFRVSVYDAAGKIREIASVQPGGMAERVRATKRGPRGPELADGYAGRCIEVRFQRMTEYGRCIHAVFSRWRPDKNPKDCVCEEG
jgi:ATP-dependent DNA ligase